jgi:8-oxo-dGTP diphosphatase
MMPVPEVRAAGAVLWRPAAGGGVELALVHRPRYDDWSLPKGKLDAGEQAIVGGCREVIEETGVEPVVGPRLPTVSYPVHTKTGELAQKVVDYWAMRAARDGRPFTPNHEVDDLTWLSPADAAPKLSYAHDQRVLAAFTALPAVTGTVLLIRHCHAGERKQWHGADALRPLDDAGRAQAENLARVLPWFAPRRVFSADQVRCMQSVEPLAGALGVEVEVDPVFSETQHAPRLAAQRVCELAATGEAVAVCSQGGVIPETVALLAVAGGPRLDRIAARKGSVWVLSFHGSTLAAADYLPNLGA